MPTTPLSSSDLSVQLASVAEANAYAAELLIDLELARERLEEQNHALDQARRAAEESARCKSIFLATMSHELRTPLNAIIGYSEMLSEDAQKLGLPVMTEDLERIRAAGRRLLGLINDILDYSKIEAGRLSLRMERVAVVPLFREVAETVLPLMGKNRNTLTVSCPDESLAVQADRFRLAQCLLNLLSNAARFTEDGQVLLAAERTSASAVSLLVRDTGIGIDGAFVDHLFEPFTQAANSEVRVRDGTGLGLAISRGLARLMKGDLAVESRPGAGSTFTLRLEAALHPEY